jgi:hypothetical protein
MRGSKLAKFGRSKEKRADAKLVVLALVINPEGFIKYSDIFQGNISDPATLGKIIDNLRERTSHSAHKATVVIDAGIASDGNLKLIKEKGYEYICVTRSSMKDYSVMADGAVVTVRDNKQQKIELCQVTKEGHTDYFLKIESHSKELKERSMNEQFQQRFEEGMQKIADSLTKKGGIKQADKVHERIGRLKQKFPSIGRYYDIEVEVEPKPEPKKKGKGKGHKNLEKENEIENKIVTSIKWSVKEGVDINVRSGVYFLQTSIQDTEKVLWDGYNTIREIEATFYAEKKIMQSNCIKDTMTTVSRQLHYNITLHKSLTYFFRLFRFYFNVCLFKGFPFLFRIGTGIYIRCLNRYMPQNVPYIYQVYTSL